jgi:hypothetical protein
MEYPIVRRDHPPARRGPHRKLVRILTAKPLRGVCLSRAVFGFDSHWDGSRSLPCTSNRGTCEGHKAGWPKRWKGILHIWIPQQQKSCFVEITPRADVQMVDQTVGLGTYRGLILEFTRTKGGKNGRLNVSVLGRAPNGEHLPPEESPWDLLKLIWGWSPDELDGEPMRKLA